ncbi:MAG: chemotaxis protein CheW [Ignavibacteriaceae bacterium]|jgi:chemotaxis signal transduction protein/CheY-like chemotaxis protein/ABC-type nitrate/sulfonate/bicarbonate transport system substrate-binding protein
MAVDKNIKILLVEDAGVMRKMEIKTLNSLDFNNVSEAENGKDAIELLIKDPAFELIISDWNMPVKDGFELLNWVRSNENTRNIPFLMATGRGEKKEVEKASEAGVSSFISKPFNKDELFEKINEAFGVKSEVQEQKPLTQQTRISSSGKVRIKAVHIQITDHLTLGILKNLIRKNEVTPKHFELETECMPSWNTVAKALENKTADAAFILAPLAMDLYNYGVPLRLILFAHKNGSICVKNKTGDDVSGPEFFKNKSFYIPHTMSIHNMLGHIYFNNIGLKPGVTGQKDVNINFEVVAPIKMGEFMAGNEDASGFMVAEPLGTKAIAAGSAELQFLSSEVWENHPCCVLAVQEDLINNYPDAVQEFTSLLVQAGKVISQKPGYAAEVAVEFLDPKKELGLKVPILKNVLTEPKGIKTDNLYPVKSDLNFIQNYMHDKMGIGSVINLDNFVDLKFADKACSESDKSVKKNKITEDDLSSKVKQIANRGKENVEDLHSKEALNMEGKYLIFVLDNERYGIEILKIVEIIKMVPITCVPNTPDFVKGVINLRGSIVPTIDLRLKIGLDAAEYNSKTRILIGEDEHDGAKIRVGFIVDAVEVICDVKAKDIESSSSFNDEAENQFILGAVKSNDGIYLLLNLPMIIAPINGLGKSAKKKVLV